MKKYDVVGKSSDGQPIRAAYGPMTEEMANVVAEAMIFAVHGMCATKSIASDIGVI